MLSVRPIQVSDIDFFVQYWLHNDGTYLEGMGVDLTKLPSEEGLRNMLLEQINLPFEKKNAFCLIWLQNDLPIGHSNVNNIIFGKEAFMHLHLWKSPFRQKGLGTKLVKLSLPWYFENLQLQTLYCEPYALNPAPNKTLGKVGFTFIKKYITVPGSLNFEQEVNRWELTVSTINYLQLAKS